MTMTTVTAKVKTIANLSPKFNGPTLCPYVDGHLAPPFISLLFRLVFSEILFEQPLGGPHCISIAGYHALTV